MIDPRIPLVVASTLSLANAAILARWTPVSTALPAGEMYDSDVDMPTASEVAANLNVSPLDRVGLEAFGNVAAVWAGRAVPDTSVIDETVYTTFTLTPSTGYFIDLDTITYDYQSYGFASNGYNFYLRTSADGFAADLASRYRRSRRARRCYPWRSASERSPPHPPCSPTSAPD